ncbi:hypothetical protein JM47_02960 [Ureaplasma diversum]|uniref:Peptidase S8/S53 domain-containing protein n=1 Tax=Ureaplasma diversum TaxID=42094 RepID=A0A0C5S275_9BACT|nr:S8 family serine peptidase [Ureaplasma diversum]AJQ45505.1 hypothetical protein JM47_02960 [Ureaplasma diversum]
MNKRLIIKRAILIGIIPIVASVPFLGIAANNLQYTSNFELGFEILIKDNINKKTLMSKLEQHLYKSYLRNQYDYKFFEFDKKITILANQDKYDYFKWPLKQFFDENKKDIDGILIDRYLLEENWYKRPIIFKQNIDSEKRIQEELLWYGAIVNNFEQASTLEETELNYNNFKYVGLDKGTRYFHFKNTFRQLGDVIVGVSEIDKFNSNNFGRLEWNNDLNLLDLEDDKIDKKYNKYHPNQVSEIIAGSKGINQTVKLKLLRHSIKLDDENLQKLKTYVINNSYGFTKESIKDHPYLRKYNEYSRAIDEAIVKNPELIYIFSAGNSFNKEPAVKELVGRKLSLNSIVVGALSKYEYNNRPAPAKAGYSQIGNNINYLSVTTPGRFDFIKPTKENFEDQGTSFSAPVVTAIASMLLQTNKEQFDEGHNSIIFKSALITGSWSPGSINWLPYPVSLDPNYSYTNQLGFGIPNYYLVKEALRNLIYIKGEDPLLSVDTNQSYNENGKIVKIVNKKFKKGSRVRVGLSWLYEKANDPFNSYLINHFNGLNANQHDLSKTNSDAKNNSKPINEPNWTGHIPIGDGSGCIDLWKQYYNKNHDKKSSLDIIAQLNQCKVHRYDEELDLKKKLGDLDTYEREGIMNNKIFWIRDRISFGLYVYNSKNELIKEIDTKGDFNVRLVEFLADGEEYRIEVVRQDNLFKAADAALTFAEEISDEDQY